VDSFDVDEGYRHYVPHILDAAHNLSSAYDHVGPTHSDVLSNYSYNLSKKYTPSSIPYYATVNGDSVEDYEDPYREEHEQAQRHIINLHDRVGELAWGLPHDHPAKEHAKAAENALVDAHEYASVRDYDGAGNLLNKAGAVVRSMHNIFGDSGNKHHQEKTGELLHDIKQGKEMLSSIPRR
jgi:hypothetical protein